MYKFKELAQQLKDSNEGIIFPKIECGTGSAFDVIVYNDNFLFLDTQIVMFCNREKFIYEAHKILSIEGNSLNMLKLIGNTTDIDVIKQNFPI